MRLSQYRPRRPLARPKANHLKPVNIQLKTIFGDIIIEGDFSCIADAVKAAIAGKKSLRSANLSYANLRYANLRYADLSYADLSSADLSSADLSYADLSSADLRSANLS